MSTIVQKYTPENAAQWNAFLKQSINGTFLFNRSFMDYHSDHFDDHSLMVYQSNDLIGIVPAHVKNNCFYSHRGLTYGIPVVKENSFKVVLDVVLDYLKNSAFAKAEFNMTPQIYNPYHSQLLQSLLASGFQKHRVSHNMCVDLKKELNFSTKKTIGYRNGKFDGFHMVRSDDFYNFWDHVLIPSLKKRYGSKPIHSLKEIELLGSRFPKQIIQHNLYLDDKLLAGITFFLKGSIIKSQYTASSLEGMKLNAAGYIYMETMKEYKEKGFHYMDMGTVNQLDGSLNKGLTRFKKELGADMEAVTRLVKILK